MTKIPQTVKVLDTLRKNCHVGKHRHFCASKRTNTFHLWFGLPAIMISVILGSTFFALLTREIPTEAKWAAAFAALVAAVLGAVQTFFNFQKVSESHRTVANQYLSIQRECERLLAAYGDKLIALNAFSERLIELNTRYEEVNKAAEGLRTNDSDYAFAMKRLEELAAGELARKDFLHRNQENDQTRTERSSR